MILLIANSLLGQKEDNIWLFGTSSINILESSSNGYSWGNTVVDFNHTPPAVYYDSLITLDYIGANSTICTSKGDSLLLSTNAMSIHNRYHQPLQGGDTIGYGEFWEKFNEKDYPEPGQNWISGYRLIQEVIILPAPGNEAEYIVVYPLVIDKDINDYKLMYTRVSYESVAAGQVLEHDVVVEEIDEEEDQYNLFHINACRHANGRDWWLITTSRYDKKVYIYLLDPTGIQRTNTYVNPLPNGNPVSFTQMYFSPDGTKFAKGATYLVDNEFGFEEISLYDFDRCSGDIVLIDQDTINLYSVYSTLAFSPSSELLYASTHEEIYQYKLDGSKLDDSKQVVGEFDGYLFSYGENDPGTPTKLGCMAHGPDGKIYSVPTSNNRFLHTIEYPDEEGEDCNLVQRSLMLNTSNFVSTPNFPHYRMGPLDGSSCDTLGIDNNPVAEFRYEQDSTDYLNIRFTDNSYFRPETWEWDFGDGNTFSGKKPYYHRYEADGAYEVCLTVSNENDESTSCETLYIGVTSSENPKDIANISVYPNPVETEFLLMIYDYFPSDAYISLYNAKGERVVNKRVINGWNNIHVSDLPSGVYIYQVTDGSKLVGEGKIIKI